MTGIDTTVTSTAPKTVKIRVKKSNTYKEVLKELVLTAIKLATHLTPSRCKYSFRKRNICFRNE
jgi:hypothetical protein